MSIIIPFISFEGDFTPRTLRFAPKTTVDLHISPSGHFLLTLHYGEEGWQNAAPPSPSPGFPGASAGAGWASCGGGTTTR